jgi:hypothetical protein
LVSRDKVANEINFLSRNGILFSGVVVEGSVKSSPARHIKGRCHRDSTPTPPPPTTTNNHGQPTAPHRQESLKDAEPLHAAAIKKLEDATGTTGWTFEADGAAIHEALKNDGNLVGRVINQTLVGLVDNIIKLCKKDDMYKEAFVEKITAKRIKFVVTSDGPAYCPGATSFPEGVLLVTIHKEQPWVNVTQTGNKIESQL